MINFGDGATDLRPRPPGRILLVDPSLRLHDLAERPERDSFPVGEAATLPPGNEVGIRVDDLREELVDEAALADARDADERDEL